MQATKKSNAAGMHFVLHTFLRRGRKKKKIAGKWQNGRGGEHWVVGEMAKCSGKYCAKGAVRS